MSDADGTAVTSGAGGVGSGRIILCADDFGISEGVTSAISELSIQGLLSATSAIVTLPRWASDGARLAALRPYVAIGLHINLTLGEPLHPMPGLTVDGRFPKLGSLVLRGLLGGLDRLEIAEEVGRQLRAFEQHAGCPPDFVDGHQHVHALRGVRGGVLDALGAYFPRSGVLVRNPADLDGRIRRRGASPAKARAISMLAGGFGQQLRQAGFMTNDGFAGVSAFDRAIPYETELQRFLSHPGRRHMVMCHPGRRDDPELAELDPVVARRGDEAAALSGCEDLREIIWHPQRNADDEVVWPTLAVAA